MEREKTYKEPPEISQAREIMERVIATEGVAQITPEEGGIIYKAEILQAEATKKAQENPYYFEPIPEIGRETQEGYVEKVNNGEVEFTDLAQGLIAIAKIMQEMRDSILTNIPKRQEKIH